MQRTLRQQTSKSRTLASCALVLSLLFAQATLQSHAFEADGHAGGQTCDICHLGQQTTGAADTTASVMPTPGQVNYYPRATFPSFVADKPRLLPPNRAPPQLTAP